MNCLLYLAAIFFLASRCKSVNRPCVLVSVSSMLQLKKISTVEAKFHLFLKITDGNTEFDTVVNFVAEVFSSHQRDVTLNHCSSIIGVVGDLDLKTASILHTLASRANLNITLVSAVAPSTFQPTTHLALPNLLHMNPLTHYVEATAAFLDRLNWTRIGLISDNTPYYEFAAELIQQKLLENPKRKIVPLIEISKSDNKTETVQTFCEYKTDVIIVATDSTTACLLFEEAQRATLTWPRYAWIYFEATFDQICDVRGAIALTSHTVSTKSKAGPNSRTSSVFDSTSFQDSILAVSAASNSSFFSGSFTGATGQVKFREGKRLANICFIQTIDDANLTEIAVYNTGLQKLSVLRAFLSGDQPRGTTLALSYTDYSLTLRLTLINVISVSLFSFVTGVLILYILFRKEPEVKATSISVSLFMFLGRYTLILYMPVSEIDPTINFHCHLLIWISLCGLPYSLIVATLLIKMLRVYLIFKDPYTFYQRRIFSDAFLFFYIMLLVSPTFFILVLWSSIDPFGLVKLASPQDNFVFVYDRCQSTYTIYWMGSLLFYGFILFSALVCLALISSKIPYKNFRDTKETNAFTYLSLFIISLTLIYWYFFRLQELRPEALHITGGILNAAHSSVVILCQVLLFVPKVYPPLTRKLMN